MTADEFRDLLNQQTDQQLLDPCLRDENAPFVFGTNATAWEGFRNSIATDLPIVATDIRIVGSARFGFSLKPERNLHPFSDKSDVDVVIVNSVYFDLLWYALLEAAYPRGRVWAHAADWLKIRNREIYTGWVTPAALRLDVRIFGNRSRPLLGMRTAWFNALQKAAALVVHRHESISGRLYRTWRHAELYHLDSLAALRRSL